MVVFYWSPRADWQAVEVSTIAGRTLAPGAPLTSWQTPDGPYIVEHLAGVDGDGNVVVFYWSPRADWQAVEVSTIAGRTLAPGAPLTSWQTPDGPYIVEHLAGVDGDGNVVVFYWSPRADWQAVEVSTIAGKTCRAGRGVVATSTTRLRDGGWLLVEKLAGVDTGAATVFSWSPAHDWSALDVSAFTRVRFTETPASWHLPDGPFTVEHLAGPTTEGNLAVIYWRSPS